MSEMIQSYIERGGQPLTIERVEHIINSFAILPPPQNIIMLDGVIDVESKRMAVGAYPIMANYIILTPLSNEKTVIHEWIHYALKLGERLTYPLSERLYERYMKGLTIPRIIPVKYEQAQTYSPHELMAMIGIEAEYITIPPEIRHYKLIASPIRRLQLI